MIRFVKSQPITIKAPLLVVALMILISALVSERVLSRLADTQTRHIEALVGSYLDGLSSSVLPYVLNEDIWEVFDTLERSRSRYDALKPLETVVAGKSGLVLAATDPVTVPTLSAVPEIYRQKSEAGQQGISFDDERAFATRPLRYQGLEIGTLYAMFDTAHLVAERRSVLVTLVITNVALTALLAAIGYLAVSRMVRPMRVLSEHLRQGNTDLPLLIPEDELRRETGEMAQLFERYNALVRTQADREVLSMKLAEEERIASLGRLASGMAHEINNPLGGLFNALDTLKHHGSVAQVRSTSISLLERGLIGIRDVVAATLSTYRPDRSSRALRAADLEDLKILVQPEIRRRGLKLEWQNRLPARCAIKAAPLRQAVLNLLLNACAASPDNGVVRMRAEPLAGDAISIAVADSGSGLSQSMKQLLEGDQDLNPIEAGSGLGLWMVRRLTRELDGRIKVGTGDLGGAEITLIADHVDEGSLADVA